RWRVRRLARWTGVAVRVRWWGAHDRRRKDLAAIPDANRVPKRYRKAAWRRNRPAALASGPGHHPCDRALPRVRVSEPGPERGLGGHGPWSSAGAGRPIAAAGVLGPPRWESHAHHRRWAHLDADDAEAGLP